MTLGDLLVKVGVSGLPAFQTAMGGVSASINKTFREADKAFSGFDKLGDKMADVGRSLSIGITAPLALASGAALKLATDFDAAMRGVASVIGGNVTEQQLKGLSDQVLALSKSMGIDAVDAANALKMAIGTGIPADNALEFLRVASVAAIGGITDTSTVVDALTTVIAAYGLEAADAKDVSDKMFEAVRFGKGEFSDLASSIGPAAAQAKNMGISLDDLLVAVGTLSVTSGSMSEAVTQVQSAMTGLNKATPEMTKELKRMGFSSGEAATKAIGLTGTLQELSTRTGGSTAAFSELFGRQEAVGAALGLTGIKTKDVTTNTEAMTHALDGAGASQRAFAINNESMNRQMEALKNELKGTAIEMGQALLPSLVKILEAIKPLIGMLQGAVEWFTSLSPATQQAALGFLAVGAALGPVLMAAGNLIAVFSGIAKTFTVLPGIMAPLVGAFSNIAYAVSNNMVGALTMGETMLLRMGQAALVAGTAFAAFKLGQWLSENVPLLNSFSEAFANLLVKIPGVQYAIDKFTGATAAQARASEDAAFVLKKQEEALARHGITITKAGKSQEDYAAAVTAAVKNLAAQSTEMKAIDEAIKKATTTQEKETLAKQKASQAAKDRDAALAKEKDRQDAVNKSISDSRDALTKIEALYKSGKATMSDVIKASDDLKKKTDAQDAAFLKLHPTLGKVDTSMDSLNEASWRTANVLAEQLNPGLISSYTNFERLSAQLYLNAGAWEDVMLAMDPLPDAIVDAGVSLDELNGTMRNSTAPAYELSDAFRELGQKSPEELERLAAASESLYQMVASKYPATSTVVQEAFRKMMESKIAYEKSLGNTAVAEALQKQLDAHTDHGKKANETWTKTIQQVSTVFTDFSKGIVSDLFDGEFSIGKSLTDLGKAFSRVFVEDAMGYINTFVEKGIKWLIKNLTDLLDFIPGIGSALSGVFGTSVGAAGSAVGSVGSAAGSIGGAVGSAGSTAGSTAGAVASTGIQATIGMVTGAISAVTGILQLFGVGQGGQKDRLGQISDATTYVAKVYGDMGLKDALQGMANNIAAYVSSHAGWVHDSWVELLGKAENLDALKWYADDTHYRIGEIRDSINSRLPELTAIKLALQTMPPPIVNVYVQGDLPNLITTIKTEIAKGMALQGA